MKHHSFDFSAEELSEEPQSRLPEHNLLASVLASGLSEAAGTGQWLGVNSQRERVRRQANALRWIFSDDVYCAPGSGFSFVFICEVLSLDPEALRKAVSEDPNSIGGLMTTFRDRGRRVGA